MNQESATQRGGSGGSYVVADIKEGHHNRETLSIIKRAITNGWNIPDAYKEVLPQVAAKIALDPEGNEREKLRAIEVIASMSRDNFNSAVELDRIERLDEGRATQILDHRVMPAISDPDELEAVIETIHRRRGLASTFGQQVDQWALPAPGAPALPVEAGGVGVPASERQADRVDAGEARQE